MGALNGHPHAFQASPKDSALGYAPTSSYGELELEHPYILTMVIQEMLD